MFRSRMMSLALLTAALAACSDAATTAPSADPSLAKSYGLVGIEVSPKAATLAPGGTIQLVRKFTDVSGTLLTLETTQPTWTSLAPKVATVDANGLVKGLAAGTAKIVANQFGMYTDTAVVTVGAPAAAAAPQVATVSVTAATDRVQAGQTTRLAAVVKDAASKPIGGRAVAWASSDAAVATVSSEGVVTGRGFGTATLTGTVDGKSGSVKVSVVEGAGEPAGFIRLTDRGFSAPIEGWDNVETRFPNLVFTKDASSPRSAGGVLKVRYQAGYEGGSSPGKMQFRIPDSLGASRMYVSYWMQLSPNFVGHISGTNKTFFFWIGGGARVFLSAEGKGNAALVPQIRLQGVPDARYHLTPNVVPNAQFVRGKWHHVEVLLKANTGGAANGSIEWWIDGAKVGSYKDVALLEAADVERTWYQLQLNPIWGGTGHNVPAEQYMLVDNAYLSVAR